MTSEAVYRAPPEVLAISATGNGYLGHWEWRPRLLGMATSAIGDGELGYWQWRLRLLGLGNLGD